MNTTLLIYKSEELLKKIDETYIFDKPKESNSYDVLYSKHMKLILEVKHLLIDVKMNLPEDGQRVFGVQDLSSLGKGTFLNDFFYRKDIGFVSDIDADDSYAYITHWVSFETINKELFDKTVF